MFKRLNHITDQLYEVELVKSEIEHREPIIVGFFILNYAKLRMLELYYIFFKKFCDTDMDEELEMDTDSLYLALSEENFQDVFFPKNELNGTSYVLKVELITLLQMQPTFSPRTCCNAHRKHDKREPVLFKEEALERFSIMLLRMNKQRKDCHTFIQKEQ